MAARRTQRLNAGQRALAAGLVLSVSLVAFESTAVITALPTITDDLDGLSLYGATLAAYMLANLVALVWSGETADRFGVRRPFLVCIAVFISGLVVAASATSMVVVLIGRLLQGAGSGGFAPIAYICVSRGFPKESQGAMYAYLSAGWVLPSLLAPAIAGIVTDRFGWQWVFIGIIPLAMAVAALTSRAMKTLRTPTADIDRRSSRLPKALQAAGGVALFALGVQNRHLVVVIAVGLAGLAIAFPAVQSMLPAGVFRARGGLSAIVAVRFLATATFLGVDSFVPLAADRLHGARPIVQGFVVAGAALTWTLGQALAARRGARLVPRHAAVYGFVLLFLGVIAASPVLSRTWPLALTFVGWSIGGLGMGILFNPTTVSSMSYATEGREGEISSQINLADSLGFGLMSIIGGAIVAIADHTAFSLRAAIGLNFCIAATLALIGIAASRGVRSQASATTIAAASNLD